MGCWPSQSTNASTPHLLPTPPLSPPAYRPPPAPALQAIYYPASASSHDLARAMRIHSDFVREFGLEAKPPPLLRLAASDPTAPFQEASGGFTPQMCDAMRDERLGKFWRMWGAEAWRSRSVGDAACWDEHASGADAYFAQTLNGAASQRSRAQHAHAAAR